MINLFCIRPKGFNVGNDAIFLGLQHFLYEAFGQLVNLISLPATTKYESHAKAGLTAKTIYEINQYGHGVIVGGGNLYENGELDVDLHAIGSLEVPMMLFSLSRGRVYNRQHRLVERTDAMPASVMRALDQRAHSALFRDQATAAGLRELGCQHYQAGGCPTIFLDRMAHRLPEIPDVDGSTALVSVRAPSLMSIPLNKQAEVPHDVAEIIGQLRSRGYHDVRLLCHDHRDIPFAATFSGVEYVYTGDVYSYLALLKQCGVNVSYRLHGFLPCLSFGTPAINISYDERARSLVEGVGLGSWNIDMVEQPDVVRQVVRRLDHLDEIRLLRASLRDVWRGNYDQIAQTFAGFADDVRTYHEVTEGIAHRPQQQVVA